MRRGEFEAEDVSVHAVPANVYPGFGMVLAAARVESGREQQVLDALNTGIGELASGRVSPSEVERVRESLSARAGVLADQPGYWSSLLSRASARGIDIEDLSAGAGGYADIEASVVSEAVRRYGSVGSSVEVVVRPAVACVVSSSGTSGGRTDRERDDDATGAGRTRDAGEDR